MIEIPGYHGGLLVPHRDVVVISQDWTEQEETNSTATITICNVTIPANMMGPNGSIRCTFYGSLLNNSGVNKIIRIRFKFGGTTFYDDADAVGTHAGTRGWIWEGSLINLNSISANRSCHNWFLAYPNTADTGLGGDIGRAYSNVRGGPTFSQAQTINTGANQSLVAEVEMDSTDTTVTLKSFGYRLELCPDV